LSRARSGGWLAAPAWRAYGRDDTTAFAPLSGPGVARLVGRTRELAALERLLADRRAAAAGVVALTGEPGIGKTRLLGELCARADARGLLVLEGRASELERDVPFALVIDALDDYLAALAPARLERLGRSRLAELAVVFPALAEFREARLAMPGGERYRLHAAVRVLLEALSDPRPVLLALDDVHWADVASLELVAHLLRRRPRRMLALALAYRAHQAPEALSAALAGAAREVPCELFELAPLSAEEAGELVGDAVDAAVRAALVRASGGNPFYLEELVRARGSETSAPTGGRGSGEAPAAVRAALAAELACLPATPRALLDAASVAGDPFDVDLAAAIASLSAAAALAALDQLLEQLMIRATDAPRRFRFRHPVVRRAVYESTPHGWRLAAHARAAAALEARGAPPLARAHHLERAARPGDEPARITLAAAADEAAGRAPATAARWYLAALRLLPPTADDEHRRALLVALADALRAAGRLEESLRALERALALGPDPAPAVALMAHAADLERLLGRHDAARVRLHSALGRLAGDDTPEAAALLYELACDRAYGADFPSITAWATRAHAAAVRREDPALLAGAAALLGLADYRAGELAAAEQRRAAAAGRLDRLDEQAVACRLDALFHTGWLELFLERFDDTIRHGQRGVALARRTGHVHLLDSFRVGATIALLARGRLHDAHELADAAAESARLAANPQGLSWALHARCRAAVLLGDTRAGVRDGDDALAHADTHDPSLLTRQAACRVAAAFLDAGQPERCRQIMLGAGGGPDLPYSEHGYRPHWYEALTRAALALERPDQARTWADRAQAAAADLPLPVARAAAHRAHAAVLLATGHPQAAAREALAAARDADQRGAVIDAARARILAGSALAAADDRPAGIRELDHAHTVLDAADARRLRDHAARQLRQLGRRVPRQGRRGSANTLTDREREIADLIAHGHTNRQIAAQLYLSEKTIETHLTKLYAKLGVTTRAAMIAATHDQAAGPRR
jgi:DNA-binding NarL/FixJ family response regulator